MFALLAFLVSFSCAAQQLVVDSVTINQWPQGFPGSYTYKHFVCVTVNVYDHAGDVCQVVKYYGDTSNTIAQLKNDVASQYQFAKASLWCALAGTAGTCIAMCCDAPGGAFTGAGVMYLSMIAAIAALRFAATGDSMKLVLSTAIPFDHAPWAVQQAVRGYGIHTWLIEVRDVRKQPVVVIVQQQPTWPQPTWLHTHTHTHTDTIVPVHHHHVVETPVVVPVAVPVVVPAPVIVPTAPTDAYEPRPFSDWSLAEQNQILWP